MTRWLKTGLAALYALWSVIEVAWLKAEGMMYLASAPVWFAFFEMFDRADSWLTWLWLGIALLQIAGLIAAPICAIFRRYKPFLAVLGGQLILRFVWMLRAAAEFRLHFILATALHAAIFALAAYAFTRRDMDAA